MASIEQRLKELGLGTSASPLVDFLRELGGEPFRELVQYRVKSFASRQLQDASLDNWAMAADALGLPFDFEMLARIGGTLKARLLLDATYWTGANPRSCAEALLDVLSVADDETNLGTVSKLVAGELGETEQRALLNLFMFATDLLAGLASESRMIRRFIGVRKGLFG